MEKWECAFKKDKKKFALNFDRDLLLLLLLNPRETHFGARTNPVKLYYKCLGTEQIKHQDVTSKYLYVMKDFAYPIKDFQRHRLHDPDSPLISPDKLFGLQKCDLVPPTNLYHPVLPMRDPDTGKL